MHVRHYIAHRTRTPSAGIRTHINIWQTWSSCAPSFHTCTQFEWQQQSALKNPIKFNMFVHKLLLHIYQNRVCCVCVCVGLCSSECIIVLYSKQADKATTSTPSYDVDTAIAETAVPFLSAPHLTILSRFWFYLSFDATYSHHQILLLFSFFFW